MGGLASLLARTHRHFTCSSLHFCRYLPTSASTIPVEFTSSISLVFPLMRYYYFCSYVIGLECFMVSLQDLFYVCWGSKQNQRRAALRAQELHHQRDEASSLLRHRKLTPHGTTSGLRMARGSKGPFGRSEAVFVKGG